MPVALSQNLYRPGVTPNTRRNKAIKALTLSYPRSSAIADTDWPAARSSSALSNRTRCRHSVKLKPVSAMNRRVTVRGDIPAQALRSSYGRSERARAILRSRASLGIYRPRLVSVSDWISSRTPPANRACDAVKACPF